MESVVGIIGTGVMGRGIAQLAATAGCRVILHDVAPGVAQAAVDGIRQQLRRLVEKQKTTQAAVDAAVERLQPADDLPDFAQADVIIETIVERLEAKRALFTALEAVVSPSCVLATNTSSLSVAAIAAACRQPDRVAGFHFFNPAPLMKIVEVVSAPGTAPAVRDRLVALGQRFGHRVVVVRDSPGFLVNHAGRAYGTEALRIVGEGVASHADVDRVMRDVGGFRMGPFELFDLTGLDVSHVVLESIYHQHYEEPRLRPTPETAGRHAAGLFGRKVGQGFYAYPDGQAQYPAEAPAPRARPSSIWISHDDPAARQSLGAQIAALPDAAMLEDGAAPSDTALCLITPCGEDATTACLRQGLDPTRTVAVDTFLPSERRITLMRNPVTSPEVVASAHGLLGSGGMPVTVINDSPGFIAPRIVCAIVNLACDIAQQRVASPPDVDDAVRLGLGYPRGPLSMGDAIGPRRILAVLAGIQAATGDPRYRPSPWLRRRAQLGVSLATPEPDIS